MMIRGTTTGSAVSYEMSLGALDFRQTFFYCLLLVIRHELAAEVTTHLFKFFLLAFFVFSKRKQYEI